MKNQLEINKIYQMDCIKGINQMSKQSYGVLEIKTP